jgi:hypothetical protein
MSHEIFLADEKSCQIVRKILLENLSRKTLNFKVKRIVLGLSFGKFFLLLDKKVSD